MFSHKLKIPRAYVQAYKDEQLTNEVINKLKEQNHPTLKVISQESGIPYGTIKFWNKQLQEDPNYIPGLLIGQHKRLFSKDQEENIADMIKTQYIKHGIMMQRRHLRKILIEAWKSFDLENRQKMSCRNMISYQFLKGFCNRNHLSFREMRKKRRSDVNQREVDIYTAELLNAFKTFGYERTLNMDETAWNYVYKRGKVLSIKGQEEIDASLPDDYRKSFTAISTISAAGRKFPPIFLATGKTLRCHHQFDGMESNPSDYEIYHSEGGNTDEGVMMFYLEKLKRWMNDNPCALVIDRYRAHTSDSVLTYANELDIQIVLIPTSATDMYQPLDKRVFGVMKSAAAMEFGDKAFESHEAYNKPEAADLFVSIWNRLSSHVILSAWDKSDDEYEDESESSSSSSFLDESE